LGNQPTGVWIWTRSQEGSHLIIHVDDQVVELKDTKLKSKLKTLKSHSGPVGRLVLAKDFFWRGWLSLNHGRWEVVFLVMVGVCAKKELQSILFAGYPQHIT